ncbi:type II toxin-antitoxin system RelE/ParE family toxin [Alloalcanivorax gelatiniphagus]|uniref:Toxin n=1 Tax=Alloalcanivorax gelatiniphagus TaxID=1194167 RepID=A0ABY2XKX9_9GAMM|nr:type II toxin-antitoxin system RelE/ParE family toxin [Alloalcanivorax gelatiniphagus]TMW12757.1 type II toxin-antitoxin system RelE/ParE family toxin [Alloalcanivorax gelatiniphagus]|tara:strand:- start:9290 stop:9583 length:294 start_codon:yes stop_codon:yes gene_type:complete
MPTSLVLSPAAREDLVAIRKYGALHWGKHRSDQYLDTLKEAIWSLLEYPETGRTRPELSSEIRSLPVSSHVIFYRIEREQLEIIRILHARQDVDQQL